MIDIGEIASKVNVFRGSSSERVILRSLNLYATTSWVGARTRSLLIYSKIMVTLSLGEVNHCSKIARRVPEFLTHRGSQIGVLACLFQP